MSLLLESNEWEIISVPELDALRAQVRDLQAAVDWLLGDSDDTPVVVSFCAENNGDPVTLRKIQHEIRQRVTH